MGVELHVHDNDLSLPVSLRNILYYALTSSGLNFAVVLYHCLYKKKTVRTFRLANDFRGQLNM